MSSICIIVSTPRQLLVKSMPVNQHSTVSTNQSQDHLNSTVDPMCQSIKKFYKCGHAEVILRECVKKNTNISNWLGWRSKSCTKEIMIEHNTAFLCFVCEASRLTELKSAGQTQSIMVLLIRNEKYLKRRALARRVYVEPVLDLSVPPRAEIEKQCLVNDEFLARRAARRLRTKDGGDFQAYIDAAAVHTETRRVLDEAVLHEEHSYFSSDSSSSSVQSRNSVHACLKMNGQVETGEWEGIVDPQDDIEVDDEDETENSDGEHEDDMEASNQPSIRPARPPPPPIPETFTNEASPTSEDSLELLSNSIYKPLIAVRSPEGRAIMKELRFFFQLSANQPASKVFDFHNKEAVGYSISCNLTPILFEPSKKSDRIRYVAASDMAAIANLEYRSEYKRLDWASYMNRSWRRSLNQNQDRFLIPAPRKLIAVAEKLEDDTEIEEVEDEEDKGEEAYDEVTNGEEAAAESAPPPAAPFTLRVRRFSKRQAPRPPRRPSPLSEVSTLATPLVAPLQVGHLYRPRNNPEVEEANDWEEEDSSSSDSDDSDSYSYTSDKHILSRFANTTDEPDVPKVSHHSAEGSALLRRIRTSLNLNDYFSPQDVARYIENNEDHMAAIFDGRVELPVEEEQKDAREELAMAIVSLNWKEIENEAPI